jgi:hypothetical protein
MSVMPANNFTLLNIVPQRNFRIAADFSEKYNVFLTCSQANCSLVIGEVAEMAGLLTRAHDEFPSRNFA